ncbi:hypothetical protein J4467_00100 [Candidatus Woesearchaeota archaeon]|nr:hypothetical protein [Candidatus Woesearchaeota archaeon]
MKQIIFLVLGLLLLPCVSALLISPAILEVEYKDNVEFNVTIINDISQDIVVQVTFESYEGKIVYTDYFEIEDYRTNKIEISGGESKILFFNMEMPELEQFGDVRFAVIRFYQVPLTESNMAATVAVLIPVETNIPYPDTYVKIDLEEPGVVQQGDDIVFSAVLTHLGQNVIGEITGNFILSGENFQDEVSISALDLFLPSESQTVQANYNTLELEPGKYNLSLSLSYDGLTKDSNAVKLIVGEESVEILDFNPKTLKGNSVNTATFTLFSYWVEDLDVDLGLDLVKDGSVVKSFELGGYTLPVNEEKTISSGIDLAGIYEGNYIARVNVNVGDVEITNDFEVTINNDIEYAPKKESKWLLYTSIILCLVAVGLFVVYIIKRKKDEENYFDGNI